METADRYYPNYDSLSKSGEPGNWIPAFIPRSAVEIRERHKIDTGAEVLTFYFSNFRDISLERFCERVMSTDIELPPSGFLFLNGGQTHYFVTVRKNAKNEEYVFYRCERQSFLAVKKVGDRFQAFYWGEKGVKSFSLTNRYY
jgi:hypothetical protein